MKKNIKKKDNFGKNNKKKTWEKLKIKLNSQPIQYWKNKFDKDNLKTKKTCGGNTADKQKPCKENTVVIYSVLNNYKAKFSISLIYIKKSTKMILKKKLFNKKPCRETLQQSSVLKKKLKN